MKIAVALFAGAIATPAFAEYEICELSWNIGIKRFMTNCGFGHNDPDEKLPEKPVFNPKDLKVITINIFSDAKKGKPLHVIVPTFEGEKAQLRDGVHKAFTVSVRDGMVSVVINGKRLEAEAKPGASYSVYWDNIDKKYVFTFERHF